MTERPRQYRGWITLILLAAIYYPLFGKGLQGIALYAAAGRCILLEQPCRRVCRCFLMHQRWQRS